MKATTESRLRELEAHAFRTGQHAVAIDAPGERTITQRLDHIEQRLEGLDTKLDQVLAILHTG